MENLSSPLYYDESELKRALDSELEINHFRVTTESLSLKRTMSLPFGVIESRPSGCVYIEGVSHGIDTAGFGEGATLPQPWFTDDSGLNIKSNITRLMQVASRQSTAVDAIESIQNFDFENGRFPTARIAAEMAIIDMVARGRNESVINLLDLNHSYGVLFGHSIGADNSERILIDANLAIKEGAKKIKIKVSPSTHDFVVESIKILQDQHSDLGFMVDANGSYDPTNPDHILQICELDNLDLMMIEEPVSRSGEYRGIDAVRKLRQNVKEFKTRICLDDCIQDEESAKEAVDEELAEIINIKPGRMGSILKSLVLIDWISDTLKYQTMTGGMLEATPGRTMTTVVAAYCYEKGSDIPGDLSLAQDRLSDDLVPSERQLHYGKYGGIALPLKSGWGY